MAKLPEEVVAALQDPNAIKMMATVNKEKQVNIAPIGSMTAIDEETLAFACCFAGSKTQQNLNATRKAAVAVFQPPMDGFQVKGNFAGWQKSGPLYDNFCAKLGEAAKALGAEIKVDAVGLIKVTEAYAISIPLAGEKIA